MEKFSMRGGSEASRVALAATGQFANFYGGEQLTSLRSIDRAELLFWMQDLLQSLPSTASIVFSQRELLNRVLAVIEGSEYLNELYTGATAQGLLRTRFGLPDAPGSSTVAVKLAENDGLLVSATQEFSKVQTEALAVLKSTVWELYTQALAHAAQVQAKLENYQKEEQELSSLSLSQAEGFDAKTERSKFLADVISRLQAEKSAMFGWLTLAQTFFSGSMVQAENVVFSASRVETSQPKVAGGVVM